MNRLKLPVLLAVLAGYAAVLSSPPAGAPERFLSTAQVLKIVKESDTVYNIVFSMEGLEDVNSVTTADKLFPLSVRPIEYPWRTRKEDGAAELVEFPLSSEARLMIEEAESHFRTRRYPQALLSYQNIIDRYPDCCLAYAHLGDTYYVMRQFHKALEYFDKSIEINPLDHRVFFYKGDALMHLGRHDEAKAAYVHSLSLRPRYPFALAALRHWDKTLNIEVRTDLFRPRAILKPEEGAVALYIDKEPHLALWLSYAATKAIWLGEPSHREKMTGNPTYCWSALEEMESLLNLVATYHSLRRDGKIPPDPRLDLLETVVEARDLYWFVHYEIAARMCPHITLTFTEEARQSLREFIAKYVVVAVRKEPVKKANEVVAAEVALPAVPEHQSEQQVVAR